MNKLVSAGMALLLMSISLASFAQNKEAEKKAEKEKQFQEQAETVREAERARAKQEERLREQERAMERYVAAMDIEMDFEMPEVSMPSVYLSTDNNLHQYFSQQGSSSQLSLSKRFKGESSDNDGSFDVDESVRSISLHLSGSATEGSIHISITLPNGDDLKDITIDSSADITFTQSIKIAEDVDRYYGEWEYSVEADKAVGNYRLSINTR